jgi:hypothetical protein
MNNERDHAHIAHAYRWLAWNSYDTDQEDRSSRLDFPLARQLEKAELKTCVRESSILLAKA